MRRNIRPIQIGQEQPTGAHAAQFALSSPRHLAFRVCRLDYEVTDGIRVGQARSTNTNRIQRRQSRRWGATADRRPPRAVNNIVRIERVGAGRQRPWRHRRRSLPKADARTTPVTSGARPSSSHLRRPRGYPISVECPNTFDYPLPDGDFKSSLTRPHPSNATTATTATEQPGGAVVTRSRPRNKGL